MRATLGILALCLGIVTSTGCSFLAPTKQSITVIASDPAATIYADGLPLGTGPVTVELKKNRNHAFMATVGDRAGVANLGRTVSPVGFVDLIGGMIFLVPWIGVAAPGFWSLEQDTVLIAVPAARDA